MKYEKSLEKRYGNDIIGALKAVYCSDNEIPKFKNKQPDELREYLKKHSPVHVIRPVTNDYTYNVNSCSFTPSKGINMVFNVPFSNGGTDKTLELSWSQLATFIRNNMDEIFPGMMNEIYAVNEDADTPSKHSTYIDLILSKETAEPVPFNYSVLDDNTAMELQHITKNVVRVKQQYVFGMAEQVKAAHDLLASHDKTKGVFGKWCEFIGISTDTAERLIDVSAFCGNITAEENARIQSLPKSLLYTVAKDDKRGNSPEAVQAVLDGDITTHKDYIALKEKLENAEKELEAAELSMKISDERAERNYQDYLDENGKTTQLTRENVKLKNQLDSANADRGQLRDRVKELENRPIDVATVPDEEIDRRAREQVQEILNDKDREWNERFSDVQFENRQLRKQLSEAQDAGGSSEEQLTEFYELLHDKAKYALKDCVSFISGSSVPDDLRERLKEKFRNFTDLLELYFDDLHMEV